jgi:hypothetical protein
VKNNETTSMTIKDLSALLQFGLRKEQRLVIVLSQRNQFTLRQ